MMTDDQAQAIRELPRGVRQTRGLEALLADREERVRLLREVYPYLQHHRDIPTTLQEKVKAAVK